MPRITETTVYKFEELSEKAQEHAIEKWRESDLECEWWDAVFENAKRIGAILGITIKDIFFSGFPYQGQGACFEGDYKYRKGALKEIKQEAPQDKKLHQIAAELQKVQRRYFYGLTAWSKPARRHFNMDISVFDWNGDTIMADDEVVEALEDFAHWIYKQLEAEFDYMTSDEHIKEGIIANDYEFTEEGEMV